MGIAQKGKRRIIVENRLYYWNVRIDEYAPLIENAMDMRSASIVADDRKFAVEYLLGSSYITITGKEFKPPEILLKQIGHMRVRCPVWATSSFTPAIIEAIIRWCLSPKEFVTLLDWRGDTQTIITTTLKGE